MKNFDKNDDINDVPTLSQSIEDYANLVASLSAGANIGIDASGWFNSITDFVNVSNGISDSPSSCRPHDKEL